MEPLPEAILQDPPVYFDVDSKRNVWTQRLVVDKFGSYQLTEELVIFKMTPMPRYRFEMQASTGHWVAYGIMELNDFPSLHWQVLTDWKVIDVDGSNWIQWWTQPPPNWSLHSFTQGIWFGATKASTGASPWSINIVNTHCGWF